MSDTLLTVSKLTSYIKDILDNDELLSNIRVSGEISNFKYHSSGHLYFTLKDNNAKIKCVMFKSYALFLKFMPEDGMRVIIDGSISLYERDGQYQLYCHRMQEDGIGNMYVAFEKLKEKLSDEGLFDESNKKPIPLFPRKIGVVTSSTGSVIRDIINVASNRFYNVNIMLYPVKVQGEGAGDTISEAIRYFNTRNDVDVIIVGRGGGSIEELWAFNEEIVAREIYKSSIPIISAVGHETDFTIADFVADRRASTPSHAAEIAVPLLTDIQYKIKNLNQNLIGASQGYVQSKFMLLDSLRKSIMLNSPENVLKQNIQYIDNIQNKMLYSMNTTLTEKNNSFSLLMSKLDSCNPAKMMQRGYAYIQKNGKVVKSTKQIKSGDSIDVHLSDGLANCKVLNILEDR